MPTTSARAYGGGVTPKCASASGITPVIEAGGGSSPTVSIGTSESPAIERAVGAAAHVVAPAEVGELPARGRRDDQLARVRVRERRPGAFEAVRVVEDRRVARRREAVLARREPELLAVAPGDRLVALAEEDDLDRGRRRRGARRARAGSRSE